MYIISKKSIVKFRIYLIEEEKSASTVDKYIRDVAAFINWLNGRKADKKSVLEYKNMLMEKYAPASVNAALSSLNSFFSYKDWNCLKVKTIKIQRQIFSCKKTELTKREYERLLDEAFKEGNKRLYYLMQAICATGIRVSEHRFITVESLKTGYAYINCKGKMRTVIFPKQLCRMLLKYTDSIGITTGSVFVSKKGKPIDRSNIWRDMKKLCHSSGISREKVFPHNLRHLFARTYYSIQKDVVRLADILGHSSINTTRIYTMEQGDIHRKQIQKLGLLKC